MTQEDFDKCVWQAQELSGASDTQKEALVTQIIGSVTQDFVNSCTYTYGDNQYTALEMILSKGCKLSDEQKALIVEKFAECGAYPTAITLEFGVIGRSAEIATSVLGLVDGNGSHALYLGLSGGAVKDTINSIAKVAPKAFSNACSIVGLILFYDSNFLRGDNCLPFISSLSKDKLESVYALEMIAKYRNDQQTDSIIEAILKTGYNVNLQDPAEYGADTALHLACKYGNYQAFIALIRGGAALDIINTNAQTPSRMLHFPVQYQEADGWIVLQKNDVEEGRKKISTFFRQMEDAPLIKALTCNLMKLPNLEDITIHDATRVFMMAENGVMNNNFIDKEYTALEYIILNKKNLDPQYITTLIAKGAIVSKRIQDSDQYKNYIKAADKEPGKSLLAGAEKYSREKKQPVNTDHSDVNNTEYRDNDLGLGPRDLALLYYHELRAKPNKSDGKMRDRQMRQHAYFCAGFEDLRVLLCNINANKKTMFTNSTLPKDVLIALNHEGHTIALYLKYDDIAGTWNALIVNGQ